MRPPDSARHICDFDFDAGCVGKRRQSICSGPFHMTKQVRSPKRCSILMRHFCNSARIVDGEMFRRPQSFAKKEPQPKLRLEGGKCMKLPTANFQRGRWSNRKASRDFVFDAEPAGKRCQLNCSTPFHMAKRARPRVMFTTGGFAICQTDAPAPRYQLVKDPSGRWLSSMPAR